VSKRYAILRRVAPLLCALLATSLLATSAPAASKKAAAAKPAKVEKQKKAAADKATAAKAASDTTKTAKAAKPPKPPRPPEKSWAEQKAEDGPWAKRTNWLSLRAGYAKSSERNGGDGLGGYGIAYQHMLSRHWSFGGAVQHDILGHIGDSYEVTVPFTLELVRHYRWKTAVRPYTGFGAGYFFHKYYRTGADYTGAPGSGVFVNLGANLPLSDRHLLGLDTRIASVAGRDGVVNPVFGPEKASQTFWSIKLNWAMAY
jgi:hypothetical protein